jgi:hypothetical protein
MTMLMILAWAVFAPRFITVSHLEPGRPTATTPAHKVNPTSLPSAGPEAEDDRHRVDRDDALGPVDLYGNEVTDAVAKYRLDASGTLYELHSPRTEVPRLGSPKS